MESLQNTKTISRTWKISASMEYLVLFLMGIAAISLHAKLRIPMHLPGHHGLEFMALLIAGRLLSNQKFASSLFSLGVASVIFIPFMGFKDPFMTLVYILPGFTIDLFYNLIPQSKLKTLLIILISGFAYSLIPLTRYFISSLTGFPYGSLITGLFYPISLHFAFGLLGGLMGTGISKIFK